MFDALLGAPCDQVILGRREDKTVSDPEPDLLRPFVTWQEVFANLDMTGSLPYLARLVRENEFLGVAGRPKGPAEPEIPVEDALELSEPTGNVADIDHPTNANGLP
jgi:hypothetical protein